MDNSSLFVSIIIPNHNYAEFVGAAIESALRIDWPHLEVIVVDDGSTDGSRAVISGYADRATVILQEQSTQRIACNVGFARSRGDVVIFLDSDDVLDPTIIRELAAIWRPGISKVQFQMARIDSAGNSLGSIFPQYDVVPTPERIRDWLSQTSAYPTPPGSGNAYARWFLEKIFPLDGSCGDFSDSACLAAAPYLGDVVTIAKPLVSYRVHGRNDGAFSDVDVSRFGREVQKARQRFAFSQQIAKTVGITVPDDNLVKSIHFLQHRVVSIKFAPALHPIAGDTLGKAIFDGIRGASAFRGASFKTRLAILLWAVAVAVSPRWLARQFVLWKFVPAAQPKLLRAALARTGIVRGR